MMMMMSCLTFKWPPTILGLSERARSRLDSHTSFLKSHIKIHWAHSLLWPGLRPLKREEASQEMRSMKPFFCLLAPNVFYLWDSLPGPGEAGTARAMKPRLNLMHCFLVRLNDAHTHSSRPASSWLVYVCVQGSGLSGLFYRHNGVRKRKREWLHKSPIHRHIIYQFVITTHTHT